MCGIFGVLSVRPDRLSTADLDAVVRDLQHRGPDATSHERFGRVALAHTRLAMLDLDERSNQPMWDASGRYCLVYNGEVYNFRSLRAELEAEGQTFHTESDTEVVLNAIVQRGEEALEHFEGMFALAFYDVETDRLLLARDRFGIKPLVYKVVLEWCFGTQFVPDILDMFDCLRDIIAGKFYCGVISLGQI